jgi:Zn-dependent protease
MVKLLILLFGLLKLGKVGGTALTMLVSLAVYATIFGWRYAAGFIGLIFVHEMGHFLAARQRGLAVSTPTFIPFVGAWIQLKDQPMNVETEAYVAAAGPFIGTIGAAVIYFWGRETESGLLLAIAYSGFFINFFNLIPLSPLDGGRITAILSPRVWFIGAPMMLAIMLYHPSPLLVVIAIASAPALIRAWKYDPAAPENRAYYGVPASLKVEYGLFYLGLAAFLAIMTDATQRMVSGVAGG